MTTGSTVLWRLQSHEVYRCLQRQLGAEHNRQYMAECRCFSAFPLSCHSLVSIWKRDGAESTLGMEDQRCCQLILAGEGNATMIPSSWGCSQGWSLARDPWIPAPSSSRSSAAVNSSTDWHHDHSQEVVEEDRWEQLMADLVRQEKKHMVNYWECVCDLILSFLHTHNRLKNTKTLTLSSLRSWQWQRRLRGHCRPLRRT